MSDCIFEIHQLWQSGFSREYSNCCCSCSFEPDIIKTGQSFHKMCSNNILNFQEYTTILNAYTKKSGNLLNIPRIYTYIYIYIYIYILHVLARLYIYIYIYIHIHKHANTCRIRVSTCWRVCIYIYIYIYIQACQHVQNTTQSQCLSGVNL